MDPETLPRHSPKAFPDALDDLLRALQTQPLRPVTLRQFFSRVEGYGYDALRKMTRGELNLQPAAMEAIAEAAGIIEPDYFLEYRIYRVREAMMNHPDLADDCYSLLMGHTLAAEQTGQMRSRRRKRAT